MLRDKALRLIEKIEQSNKSIIHWLLLFYGIVIARTLVESLIGGLRSWPLPITLFVHFPLFYFNFFTSIAFILWFFTGEKIQKTTKVVIAFSFLIIVVPIVDFALFGSTFHYRYPMDPTAILKEMLALGGLLKGSVLLPGQAVAIWAAMLLITLYVALKGKSWKKGVMASAAFYLAGVFFSAFPLIGSTLFGLGNTFNSSAMLVGIALFLLSALALSIAWLYTYDRKLLIEFTRELRPLRTAHYLNLVVLGWVLAFFLFPPSKPNFLGLFFAAFSVFTAFESCLLCNNLYDNQSNSRKSKEYWSTIFALAVFSLASAYLAGLEILGVIIIALVAGFYYSTPPIRLKRLGFLNNMVIGFLSMLVFWVGFLAQHRGIGEIPANATLAVLLTFSLAASIKDLKDYESDKKEGIKTLPVLLGKKNGLKATAALTSVSFLIPPVLLNFKNITILAAFTGIANYLLLNKTKTEKITFAAYFLFAAILGLKIAGFL